MGHSLKKKFGNLTLNQMIRLGVILAFLLAAAIIFLPKLQPQSQASRKFNSPAMAKEKTFSVKGSLFASAAENREIVYLPEIEVFMKERNTGAEYGNTKTDKSGRFHISGDLQDGSYSICWRSNGWQEGCNSEVITRDAPVKFIKPIGISGNTSKNAAGDTTKGRILGRVTMKDGEPCSFENRGLNISQQTTIQILDKVGNEKTAPIRANANGYFAIPDIDSGEISLRAECGGTTTNQIVNAGESLFNGELLPIKLDNTNPKIAGVTAFDGNSGIRNAKPGQRITLQATAFDSDRDNLKYSFYVAKVFGSIASVKNNIAEWQLPEMEGSFDAYVIVSDNKGGIDFQRFKIRAALNLAPSFSGTLRDENGQPISEAQVTVNSSSTQTDRSGAFVLDVVADRRYVLNITKTGRIPVNRIYDREQNGLNYTSARAFAATIDPTKAVLVREPARTTRTGTRRGSTLSIPANTLINMRTRQPARTPLQLYIATLDIGNGEMPGDNGAINRNGRPVSLTSFGAVFMEIRDERGDTYNLASAIKNPATLTMPIEPSMIPQAPASIPTWTFSPPTGLWNALSSAPRRDQDWQMQMPVISTVNADLEFNTPACIQVNVDTLSPIFGMTARFTVNAQTFNLPLTDAFTMIHHLPENVLVLVEVLDSSGTVIPNIEVRIAGSPVPNPINSGATTSPPEPPYPYSSCDQKIQLEIVTPAFGGQFLTIKGVGDDITSQAYLDVIDPFQNRTTLGAWWAANGFDSTGNAVGQSKAAYFNNNDLHFGREMHCLQTGSDVACYVSNYTVNTGFPNPVPDANQANSALINPANKNLADATVVMEYKAIDGEPPANRIVKFLAYLGGVATSPLLLSPDLDGGGPKGMPQLCLTCHGGNYFPSDPLNPTQAEVNMGSSFREFDLDTFIYPSANPRAAQEANFLSLNNIVVASAPSPAIQDLISNWYSGGLPQDNSYVPSGWSAEANLYSNVVATSCRTCHISLTSDGKDFSTQVNFENVVYQSAVCGANKFMPHAKVTFENFWQSTNPARPQLLAQRMFANGFFSSGVCAP